MTIAGAKKWVEVPISGQAGLKVVDVNEAVRDQAENLSELHQKLYEWSDRIGKLIHEHTGVDLPEIALGIESGRKNRLGWYTIGRDGLQLQGRVSLNSRYLKRPFCWILEVLCHEQLHFAEELAGEISKAKNSAYHTAWFRRYAGELGIDCDLKGRSSINELDPKSPFGRLLLEHGVELVRMSSGENGGSGNGGGAVGGDTTPGKSTLKKWRCECTNIRASTVVKAICLVCKRPFRKAEVGGDKRSTGRVGRQKVER